MLHLDIQRFAGEKTERATPKRRMDARREGQIPKSADLTSAAVLVAILMMLKIFGPNIWLLWERLLETDFTHMSVKPFTDRDLMSLMYNQLDFVVQTVGPLLGIAMVFGIVISFVQTGPGFWPNLLVPDFSRIGVIGGLSRLFSTRSFVEAAKSILKLGIVGSVVWTVVHGMAIQVVNLIAVDVVSLPALVGHMAFQIGIDIAIMMLALSVLDFFFQRFDFEKSIRMSRDEIKQERKDEDGDPLIKSAIRHRGRKIAFQRMMQDVPKADVVVTNPTHFAVALLYDGSRMSAPQVVAKGQNEVARRIKEVAVDTGVPMVENKPLAQTLYHTVDIGRAVPAQLYQAVAEVLAYVYGLKQSARRG